MRVLSQNNSLENRAAWRRLKEAKEIPEPHYLHVLSLAQWGLDNGARGDWPAKERHTLGMQVAGLFGWNPENVMTWLVSNEDGPNPAEQRSDLLANIKYAADPLQAATRVLNQIWAVQRSHNPILSTVSD